jgi:pimeloyl-ACP methyl ester carboxylesterase
MTVRMTGDWVLLRGLAREAAHWGDFGQRLEQRVAPARVVAIDLPGAGQARGLPVPLRIDGLLAHVQAQATRLGLQAPLSVIGLSLGGMVAARWAQVAPQALARVVLVNSSLRPPAALHQRLRPAVWWPLLRVWAARDGAAAERRVLQLTSAGRGIDADAVLSHWLALRQQRPVARLDALRQLAAAALHRAAPLPPSVPVLLLASAGDRLVDAACSQRLAAAWACKLALHPWAGHDLPLDDPQWVLEQVLGSSMA